MQYNLRHNCDVRLMRDGAGFDCHTVYAPALSSWRLRPRNRVVYVDRVRAEAGMSDGNFGPALATSREAVRARVLASPVSSSQVQSVDIHVETLKRFAASSDGDAKDKSFGEVLKSAAAIKETVSPQRGRHGGYPFMQPCVHAFAINPFHAPTGRFPS